MVLEKALLKAFQNEIIDIDEKTGKATYIKRVVLK